MDGACLLTSQPTSLFCVIVSQALVVFGCLFIVCLVVVFLLFFLDSFVDRFYIMALFSTLKQTYCARV